jgi:hypothetical protein
MMHHSCASDPDERYFLVKNRLWRCTNPALPKAERGVYKKTHASSLNGEDCQKMNLHKVYEMFRGELGAKQNGRAVDHKSVRTAGSVAQAPH